MSIITTIIWYSKNDLLKIPQNTFSVSSAQGIPARRVSLLTPTGHNSTSQQLAALRATARDHILFVARRTVRRTTRLCGLSPVWPCRRSVPSAIVVEIRLSLADSVAGRVEIATTAAAVSSKTTVVFVPVVWYRPYRCDPAWRSGGHRDHAIRSGRHHAQVAETREVCAVDVVRVRRVVARPHCRERSDRTDDYRFQGVGVQIVQARETGEAVQ